MKIRMKIKTNKVKIIIIYLNNQRMNLKRLIMKFINLIKLNRKKTYNKRFNNIRKNFISNQSKKN